MSLNNRFFYVNYKLLASALVLPVIITACSIFSPFKSVPCTPTKTSKEEVAETSAQKNLPLGKKGKEVAVNSGKKSNAGQGKVVYSLDFTQNSKEDARKWLTEKGFNFESDAKSQSELAVSFANESLVLEAKEKLFGLIINGSLNIKDAKKIKITWAVQEYPKGASYAKGVRNEAVMVYVYYGDKKFSSGSLFIPNSPYFLGLYLGETDKTNIPVKGKYFNEGGRFICVANPKPGETVITEFDLEKGFKESFGKDKTVPFISGVALEVETSKTGPSKSFIKKIEIIN